MPAGCGSHVLVFYISLWVPANLRYPSCSTSSHGVVPSCSGCEAQDGSCTSSLTAIFAARSVLVLQRVSPVRCRVCNYVLWSSCFPSEELGTLGLWGHLARFLRWGLSDCRRVESCALVAYRLTRWDGAMGLL